MRVTVPSFAKLNLDLRVLHKRSDGFHELRTVFQTISLRDTLTVEFESQKQTQIDLASSIDIPDNLVVRSARLLLNQLKVTGRVRIALTKRIPMGAGLGGGSSNAAATLVALGALVKKLTKKNLPPAEFESLATSLGSDVPFFLHGGTALGMGRGTELYPLPDQPVHYGVVLATGIHVSTAEAYRGLDRKLTQPDDSRILREFQHITWALEEAGHAGLPLGRSPLEGVPLKNDFEKSVFGAHPQLSVLTRQLQRSGARPAMMTGSGSALFGLFPNAATAEKAAKRFPSTMAFRMRFVTRRQYASIWRRALSVVIGPAATNGIF